MYDSYANQRQALQQFSTWPGAAQMGPTTGMQLNYQPTYGQSGGYFDAAGNYRTGLNSDPRVQAGRQQIAAGQAALGPQVADPNVNAGSGWLPGEGDAGAPTTLGALAGGMPTVPGIGGAAGGGNVNPAGLNGGSSYPPGVQGIPSNEFPSGPQLPGGGAWGAVPGGNGIGGSIPGTQPNYPLDIGAYLNPMMGYAMQQGVKSIANQKAAAGNLNSGDMLKELMGYGMGIGANNFNNAAQIAQGQQAFGYGVDKNDRDFAYTAQQNDRNFDLQRLLNTGQLDLQRYGIDQQNARANAALQADLAKSAAQAAAGGNTAQGGAVQQSVIDIIKNALGLG